MKIVVLDGWTLNPGDLCWDALQSLGDCEIHDRTAPDMIVSRAAHAGIVLTNKTILDRATIEKLPDLRYVGVLATGFNNVDAVAARERGIPVCNVPGYSTRSVAQTTMALLLELTHRVGHHAATVRDGLWAQSPDFCYWDQPLIELDGLNFGIVGFGRIGQTVAEIGRAFGMNILAYRRPRGYDSSAPVEFVDLDTLFQQSDVISLHCPLTPDTKGLINTQRLAQMKPGALLINTSRGPLIVEKDLADALNAGCIAGAGLDVLAIEPPQADNPLLGARNCLVTPHYAWATTAARRRLLQTTVDNIRAFLAGTPRNVVNQPDC